MTAKSPLCVQIAALGGQGGGVLAEWLAEAARDAGYPAQMTSIPGVAQRTGATTYYFEMYPQRDCPEKPVFCLSPDADGLDLMVAMEPMEAARALELGLITARTTVLSATDRIYSTAEKSIAGDGTLAAGILFEALQGAAKTLVGLDLGGLGGGSGGPGNATMLGAIAAAAILPLEPENYRQAIRVKGVAVDASLADFDAGLNHSKAPKQTEQTGDTVTFAAAPTGLEKEIKALPESLQRLAGHACATLLDYQDENYARLLLTRFQPFTHAPDDAPDDLAHEVLTRLAAWMAYEDVIRVAQLKTRPGRLARIRGEIGVDQSAPLSVIEFLKPGREEFASLLPPLVGKMIMKGHSSASTAGLPLRLPTTTVFGFAALKILAGLRAWRPRTYRYGLEQKAIERWLGVIAETMKSDPALALATAQLAVLARGYGGVRARGLRKIDALFDGWTDKLKNQPADLNAAVAKALHQARHNPDSDAETVA